MQVKFKLVPGSTEVVVLNCFMTQTWFVAVSHCPPLLGVSSSGVAPKLLQISLTGLKSQNFCFYCNKS